MAYDSVTKRGNPVSQELHSEFTTHSINSQTNGESGYKDYDEWYENEKKKKTASNIYVNPQPK